MMTVYPQEHKVKIFYRQEKKTEVLDLRNYIWRKSKAVRSNTFVFQSINSAEPKMLRVALLGDIIKQK